MLIRLVIPGKPVPQSRPRVSKWGTYYGKRSKAFRKLLLEAMQGCEQRIEGPVRVTLVFYSPPTAADTDNLAKGVLDAMVEACILRDDNVTVVRELVVRAVMDDKNPRTEVTVWELN